MFPNSANGKLEAWAHDVAVSQQTYKPVATRETLDGTLSPDGISLVLSINTLPSGSGEITGDDHTGSTSGPYKTRRARADRCVSSGCRCSAARPSGQAKASPE